MQEFQHEKNVDRNVFDQTLSYTQVWLVFLSKKCIKHHVRPCVFSTHWSWGDPVCLGPSLGLSLGIGPYLESGYIYF